jgi:ribosomal protein S18 acetylase RimI-like enzyme
VTVTVEVLSEITDEVTAAFARLLPQLSSSAALLDEDALRRLVAHEANTILIARTPDAIVGTLTLVIFPNPTGLRAHIEDVVVDGSSRGQGIGAALTQEALRLAQAAGARTVDLTSRPDRTSANRLYQRLGFEARDSQVYRFTPDRQV